MALLTSDEQYNVAAAFVADMVAQKLAQRISGYPGLDDEDADQVAEYAAAIRITVEESDGSDAHDDWERF